MPAEQRADNCRVWKMSEGRCLDPRRPRSPFDRFRPYFVLIVGRRYLLRVSLRVLCEMMPRKSEDALRARAEAAFRKVAERASTEVGDKKTSVSDDEEPASKSRPVETTEGAMDEYLARQKAERAKMAKLRELRLAAEAKAAGKLKAKRKPSGKAKR
jgi:hypothetical protein